jgi:hypothetical protein
MCRIAIMRCQGSATGAGCEPPTMRLGRKGFGAAYAVGATSRKATPLRIGTVNVWRLMPNCPTPPECRTMTNIEAFSTARRKAVKGHNDWLVWRNRDGSWSAERSGPGAVRSAMLATGTQGRWHLVAANNGVSHVCGWRLGITLIRNAKHGC